MLETIVVGVDSGEGGRDALHLARAMASIGHGRLIAVRAYPYAYGVHGVPPNADPVTDERTRAVLERDLAAEGVVAKADVVADSSPARALHRVAEAEHADMIVVGSTHHGRIGRALAGDDAVATLHGSICPVAVAPRAVALPEGSVQRIGVGYDGGPESRRALRFARALAKLTGATLELVNVVIAPGDVALDESLDEPLEPEWIPRYGEDAEAVVAEAVAELDVPAFGSAVLGLPADQLMRLSERADLLIMGSRAWGPIWRTLVGSTAARVLHGAACPVIVVPRGAATGEPGEREPAAEAATA